MHGRMLLLIALAAAVPGCAPAPLPAPVDAKAANRVISTVLLNPTVTCAELRTGFDLEYLPLAATPDEIGLDYEEIFLTAPDGVNLRVWRINAALDRGTVVFSMGSVGEMPCYLFTTRLLAGLGWNVVMYEYRGFGKSGGEADLTTMTDDLDLVLDWVLASDHHEQVTLFALSIGTLPSIDVAAGRPDDINGVILDSPVALGELLKAYGNLLRNQLETFLELLDPRIVSEDTIGDVPVPMLFLVGGSDTLTGPTSIATLYERAAEPKRLVTFPGIGHARSRFLETGRYTAEVESFLSEIWGQSVPATASE